MQGLKLVLAQGKSLNISALFHEIGLNCVIHVAQSEIIYKNTFINDDCYMSDCLSCAISGKQYPFEGLIHKLVAFIFPKDSLPCDFPTYAEYLKSDCILALLVYDVNYVEIFAKSQKLLEKILKNAEKLPVERIRIVNTQEELRTDFYV